VDFFIPKKPAKESILQKAIKWEILMNGTRKDCQVSQRQNIEI
jgi:hypothetical protein